MTRKNVVEPFLEQHPQRLSKPEEQQGCGSVRKESLLHVADDRTPVVEIPRSSILLGRFEPSWPDAEDRATWRQHESLLGTGQRHIDAPVIHMEIDRAERADDIDEEKWIVSGAVDATPN